MLLIPPVSAPPAAAPGIAGKPPRPRAAVCRHCGAPLADDRAAASGFCCSGCAYVHGLVQQHGLGAFYRIKDPVTAPADAAVFQPRDYAWLEQAQQQAESAAADSRPPQLDLEIQGISCAGCVWLIERLFQEESGGRDIVVNAQLGSVRLSWTHGEFKAAAWAARLQTFGYLLGPAGSEPDAGESSRLVRRIGLCAACTLNVMLFTLPIYFGMSPDFAFAGLFRVLSLLFATLSVLIGGSYFIGLALRALRSGVMAIDLPIAIGIVGAYAASVVGWLTHRDRLIYADFVATFIFLMLVGRWAQAAAVERNRRRLLRHQPVPAAIRLVAGGTVAREQLVAGQAMLISPGQTVPVEARLQAGPAEFSLASISGEAEPRMFGAGQRIPAGAVNVDRNGVRLIALQPWADSILAQLLAPAERASARHPLIEKVVRGYAVGILATASLAGLGWWLFQGDFARAGSVAVAVLVVSCPCAIGLALPLADEIATAALRRRGVFVRAADLWTRLHRVRRIVFDKTGTLTLEAPILLNREALVKLDPPQRRALRALVEGNFHPIAQSLLEELLALGAGPPLEGMVKEAVGSGVSLGAWSLGRAGWRDEGLGEGETVFALQGTALARFCFADAARPGAAAELGRLAQDGFDLTILSGDRQEKVSALAAELGLPAAQAMGELTPLGKAQWLERNAPDRALMLGDGANDSLAFDRALCRGIPVIHRGVLEAKADFYYLRRDLGGIRDLFEMDRRRRGVQAAIIAYSIAYNAIAVGFAIAGRINPLVAAVLMPLSSLGSLAIVGLGLGRFTRPGGPRA